MATDEELAKKMFPRKLFSNSVFKLMAEARKEGAFEVLKAWAYCECPACLRDAILRSKVKTDETFWLQRDKNEPNLAHEKIKKEGALAEREKWKSAIDDVGFSGFVWYDGTFAISEWWGKIKKKLKEQGVDLK